MIVLILGLGLWVAGHLWRRWVPGIYDGLGTGARGVSALVIILSVVAMVIGYKGAEFVPLWTPPALFTPLNNLLMLVAFYTYLTTATRTGVVWLTGHLRHPQLTGFKIWCLAHLLVNGDLASLMLFGGLLAWAVVEVVLINRQSGSGGGDIARDTAPIKSRAVHLALVGGVFVIVAALHAGVGPNPFGG